MQRDKSPYVKTHAFFHVFSICIMISCTQGKRNTVTNESGIVACNYGYGVNNNNCIAVGFYNLKTTIVSSGDILTETQTGAIPLAVLSNDDGQIFTQTSVPVLPKGADLTKSAELSNISCLGQNCVGVGFYNVTFGISFNNMTGELISTDISGSPFVTMSNNAGHTFYRSFKPPLPLDADPAKLAILNSINCISSHCVAAGVYNFSFSSNGTSSNAFMIVSNNGGESFDTSVLTLPSNVNLAGATQSHGLSCSGRDCVVVGNYNQLGIGGSLPLAVFSNNFGQTFSYPSQPPLPGDANTAQNAGAQLNGVSCSGRNCVAVGYYYPTLPLSTDSLPFTVFSNNGGKTFQTFFIPALPNGADTSTNNRNQNTQLLGVSCTGQRCVAVGTYYQQNIQGSLPLAMVSNDGGQTFQSASQTALPIGADPTTQNAQLNGITCTRQHCVAAGFYYQSDSGPGGALPLNVVSDDGGETFQMASQPVLPAGSLPSNNAELGFALGG